jgi:hypothetical protein
MLKRSPPARTAATYNHCGKKYTVISKPTGLRVEYIRRDFQNAESITQEACRKSRQPFNIPLQPLTSNMASLAIHALTSANSKKDKWKTFIF